MLIFMISFVILSLPSLIIVIFSDGQEIESITKPAEINENLETDSAVMVNVARTVSETIESVPLEQYVVGVVASEMPADFELEALKAQALAARTYIIQYLLAIESVESDDPITDSVQHQVYRNNQELQAQWGKDYQWKMDRITQAVLATADQILTYNDKPITPAFFSTSNGATENSEDYWENALPYLVSVDSPWDLDSPKYLDQKTIPVADVEERLGISLNEPIDRSVKTYTASNRVKTLELSGKIFTGREIREKLDLRSTDFEIKQKDNHLIFTTKGFGHGIGMSQYGANGMASEGKSYEEIINHYYPGVNISSLDESSDAHFVFEQQNQTHFEADGK